MMRKIFSRSIAKLVTILSLTSLVQAAQFHLPDGTPGLQKRNMGGVFQAIYEQKQVNAVNVDCEKVKCVDIHDARQDIELYLYFPTNGQQPTTEEAGEYSGARYNGPRNADVTDWWVRVFGGDRAVELSNGRGVPVADTAIPMGFDNANNPIHIIQVNAAGAPANFEQDFWQAFRTIAADPVGRVLLYRLLIEIRRLDNVGRNGICEDGIIIPNIVVRNNLRSIEIHSNNKSSFSYKKKEININLQNKNHKTLKIENGCLTTADENRTGDISLFHEMVHWFHHLRHHQRCLDNKRSAGFKYAMRSYYGNSSELKYWGRKPKVTLEGNSEEIATILGSPDYNDGLLLPMIHGEAFLPYDAFPGLTIQIQPWKYIPTSDKFLNGDDLSENAYRASRGQRMRFGHKNRSIDSVTMHPIPNRFQLAHQIAVTCYRKITGNVPQHWDLVQGEAIQP